MTLPPKSILVPIDFSEPSFKAWAYARGLAQTLGAQTEVVHVYEPPLAFSYPEAMTPMPLTKQIEKALLKRLRERLGPDLRASIMAGPPGPEIAEFAYRRGTDLIVMGTHGNTGITRVLFGSVAETLSRFSPAPVLTVREPWKDIRSILVPLNFTRYSLKGFFSAAKLAEALGASLDAVFVATEPFSKKAQDAAFRAAVRKLPPCFKTRPPALELRRGNPAEEIIRAAAQYDMIALVAHRKSFFSDLVLGTTAERVLRHSRKPVLALPTEKTA